MDIRVENKLRLEKRSLTVYLHQKIPTDLIDYGSVFKGELDEGDYLHIALDLGRGHTRNPVKIDLPSWLNFSWLDMEFSFKSVVSLTHSGERTVLELPPGPPWEFKITLPAGVKSGHAEARIAIGDVYD